MSTVKSLFKQSFIYGLSTVLPRLLNYFLVVIHTRVFSEVQYGIITELYAYVTFFLVLLTFGFETGFFRFASKHGNVETVYPTAFYFLSATSILSIVCFYFASFTLADSLGDQYSYLYIFILGVIVAIDGFCAIPFAKLRYLNKAFIFSFIKILGVVINVLLNILFLKIFDADFLLKYIGTSDLIIFVLLANLFQSLVVLFLVLVYTRLPKIVINVSLLKNLLVYSLPLLIAGLGGTTNESFDRIFIRFLTPDELNPQFQLGIYGANSKLAILLLLFIQMYRFAAEPFFFQNQNGKDSKLLFAKTFKAFIIFCSIIFLLITFNLPILQYFVGVSFRKSLLLVPILLLANILYGTFFNFSFWYKLDGKTLFGIKYTFLGACVTIVSNLLLIRFIGIYGAAVSRVFAYLLMNILAYRDGKRSGFIVLDLSNAWKYFFFFVSIIIIGTVTLYFSQVISLIVSNLLIIGFIYFILQTEDIKISSLIRR